MKMRFTPEQRDQVDKSLGEFRETFSSDPCKPLSGQSPKPLFNDETEESLDLLCSANEKSSKLSNRSFAVSVVACVFAGFSLIVSIVALFL